jgi:hypothetical protein
LTDFTYLLPSFLFNFILTAEEVAREIATVTSILALCPVLCALCSRPQIHRLKKGEERERTQIEKPPSVVMKILTAEAFRRREF